MNPRKIAIDDDGYGDVNVNVNGNGEGYISIDILGVFVIFCLYIYI